MSPRHALQSTALQFGQDGTDRSLVELLTAFSKVPQDEWPAGLRGHLSWRVEFTEPVKPAEARP